MYKDRGFRARIIAAAMTVCVGLASSGPAQARPIGGRVHGPQTVPAPGTINVLHSFAGTDGSNPQGALQYALHVSGATPTAAIFGTAQTGGDVAGDGTIFSQPTHGSSAFTSVLAFTGANGSTPSGGLSGIGGNYTLGGPFVGVASAGGKYGLGDIYEATANGAQTVLYSFTGRGDGANPIGRLVFKDGSFYGTTSAGAQGYGTVFRYTLRSGLQTLHRFTGGNDGATPLAGLALRVTIPSSASKARSAALAGRIIDPLRCGKQYIDRDLYGTTSNGGAAGTGNGTLFKISPNGTLTTLFTFTDSATAPGATPSAELATDFDGNLYGTTLTGGSSGLGEVFVYRTRGGLNVIHDFGTDPVSGNATSGANPLAALTVAFNGTLYGTTSAGSVNGLGNVFQIDANGFALKYEFAGPDGAAPQGALVDGLDGNLYGTTYGGGAFGLGTVFAIAE